MLAKQTFMFDGVGSELCVFVDIDVRITDHTDKGRASQLAILESLLQSSSGRVMFDDIVRDLSLPFADVGCWLGPAIRQLAGDRLIRAVGTASSRRLSRKSGFALVWALLNRQAAQQKVERLRSALSFIETKNDSTVAPVEPHKTETNTKSGDTTNGQAI